jgi:hypothetical protein
MPLNKQPQMLGVPVNHFDVDQSDRHFAGLDKMMMTLWQWLS